MNSFVHSSHDGSSLSPPMALPPPRPVSLSAEQAFLEFYFLRQDNSDDNDDENDEQLRSVGKPASQPASRSDARLTGRQAGRVKFGSLSSIHTTITDIDGGDGGGGGDDDLVRGGTATVKQNIKVLPLPRGVSHNLSERKKEREKGRRDRKSEMKSERGMSAARGEEKRRVSRGRLKDTEAFCTLVEKRQRNLRQPIEP